MKAPGMATGIEAQARHGTKPRRDVAHTVGFYLLLLAIAVITLGPLIYSLSGSFKTLSGVVEWPPRLWPKPFIIDNYVQVWNIAPEFPRWVVNSAVLAALTIGLNAFFGSLAGYAFARLRFPGRDFILLAALGTLMIPSQATMISQYIIVANLGWVNTYLGVLAPNLVRVFSVFLMTQFMKGLPRELDEAAIIDGCSRFGIFWRIMLPLAKPALAALAILGFKDAWNDFLWPLIVLNSPENFTLPIGLTYFRQQNYTMWNLVLAGSIISMIPVLAIFLTFQRYFVRGIAFSGIKG